MDALKLLLDVALVAVDLLEDAHIDGCGLVVDVRRQLLGLGEELVFGALASVKEVLSKLVEGRETAGESGQSTSGSTLSATLLVEEGDEGLLCARQSVVDAEDIQKTTETMVNNDASG